MSNRKHNRYENLSDQALLKAMSRVRNTRRRGQMHTALSRRGADQ